MKKLLIALICLTLSSVLLASCDSGEEHVHTITDEWRYDASGHWHTATCEHADEVSDKGAHVDSDGNELVLADIIATDKDEISENLENSVEKKLLYNSIKKLNAREKQIMYLRYGLGDIEEKTQKEVADMLGISQSYISRLEKKIISRLQKEFSKMV